jgi:hypothetical protein
MANWLSVRMISRRGCAIVISYAPARGFVAERVVGHDARSLIAAEVAGCPEYATCLRNTGSNDQCFRVDGWRGGEVSDRSYIYLRGLLR